MLRQHHTSHFVTLLTTLILLAAASPGDAAPNQDERLVVQIYDLRDLAAVLPGPGVASGRARGPWRSTVTDPGFGSGGRAGGGAGGGAGGAGGGGGVGRGGRGAPGGGSIYLDPAASASADPARRLVGQLCDAIGLMYEPLFTGVFSIQGVAADHETLAAQLRRVRELFTERYEVRLAGLTVSATDEAWRIGQAIEMPRADLSTRQVFVRRQPTEVRIVTSHTILTDVSPVSGDAAVGYDPTTDTLDDGLTVHVMVGAGEERDGGTPIRVQGELTRVALTRSSGPLAGRPDPSFAIDLPDVRRRSIESNLLVPLGQLTVIGVLEGFEDGERVVLAAEVRKLQ